MFQNLDISGKLFIQNKHIIECCLFETAIEDHLCAILSTNISQYDVTLTLKQKNVEKVQNNLFFNVCAKPRPMQEIIVLPHMIWITVVKNLKNFVISFIMAFLREKKTYEEERLRWITLILHIIISIIATIT